MTLIDPAFDVSKTQFDFNECLKKTHLSVLITDWLSHLNPDTAKTYSHLMKSLVESQFIPDLDLEEFNSYPHEFVLRRMRKKDGWSESAIQMRSAAYISFTKYLTRITCGWFRRVFPESGTSTPTFFQKNEKSVYRALTEHERFKFMLAIDTIGKRESIAARCIMQGAKRVNEVLTVKLIDVDFDKGKIHYKQSKTGGMIKIIPVQYPAHFMKEVKEYVDSTQKFRTKEDWLFVTNRGGHLHSNHLTTSFHVASDMAGIERISPHVLRTTWITEALSKGIDPLEMMIVTGHANLRMIQYYDKRAIEDNVTKDLRMI